MRVPFAHVLQLPISAHPHVVHSACKSLFSANVQCWPTLYIRGKQGLASAVDNVRVRTDGQLQYVGEWHSHPSGYSTKPSTDDTKVCEWLAKYAERDGNPPVMLIAGEKDVRLFV